MPEPEKSERSNALLAADAGASVSIEQAKERLLLATAAIGGTRRESELSAHVDALIAAVRAEPQKEQESVIEAVERIARQEAGYFTHVEPMSFGDGCRTAYLNIVAQITNRKKSVRAERIDSSSSVRAEAAQEIERLKLQLEVIERSRQPYGG